MKNASVEPIGMRFYLNKCIKEVKIAPILTISVGRKMAQVVSRQPLTPEARVGQCGIYGR
jgi:hypothetical protein